MPCDGTTDVLPQRNQNFDQKFPQSRISSLYRNFRPPTITSATPTIMHGFKKFLIAGAVQTAACLILLTLAIRYGRYGSTLIENYTLWKSFDTPLPILWAAVLLQQALTLLWFRNRPLRLKVISFWLVLATTQVARSLAIISAWNSDSKHKPIFQDPGNQAVLYMIPIFAMSPFHPIALDLGCWWTSFWEDPKRHHWRYRDFYYDYVRQTFTPCLHFVSIRIPLQVQGWSNLDDRNEQWRLVRTA